MAWQLVSNDKLNSLAVIVQKISNIDFKPIIQKFEGLSPSTMYRVIIDGRELEKVYSGNALMNVGLNIRSLKYQNESTRIEILAANKVGDF